MEQKVENGAKRNKKRRNGTKRDETEQKVAKWTLLYGNMNKK